MGEPQRVEKAVSAGAEIAKELATLGHSALTKKISFDFNADHVGFMGLCFLSEQVAYLAAVYELFRSPR